MIRTDSGAVGAVVACTTHTTVDDGALGGQGMLGGLGKVQQAHAGFGERLMRLCAPPTCTGACMACSFLRSWLSEQVSVIPRVIQAGQGWPWLVVFSQDHGKHRANPAPAKGQQG